MMIFICIINLPLFWIYTKYDVLEDNMIAKYSLGNIGGSASTCSQVPNNVPHAIMLLECKSGSLNTKARGENRKPILQSGIKPASDL
jgi:hypothetical protein